MTARGSADAEPRRQAALADQPLAAAAEARASAARYGIAAVTEKRTMQLLTPLAAVGVHFLVDRRWPGSRRAQVDLVAIGAARCPSPTASEACGCSRCCLART